MLRKILGAGAVLLAIALGAALAQDKGKGGGGGKGPAGPGLTLTSPDFMDGAVIADKYTQKGGQKGPSPQLDWTNVPMATQTFVLLLHDPDVAMGKKMDDVTHWMAFNIPGTAKGLPGGVPPDAKLADGTIQIVNTGRNIGYMGPGAPAAGPYHHYTFELFALDTKLDLGPDATRADVVKAMDGHILGKGVLECRFHQ
jgi:Raf kinase inhibitor-like YbhB/YbcL family protein